MLFDQRNIIEVTVRINILSIERILKLHKEIRVTISLIGILQLLKLLLHSLTKDGLLKEICYDLDKGLDKLKLEQVVRL